MKPKVLAVDDDMAFHAMWERHFADKVELLGALKVKEAREKFAANPDVAVIIMDGYMDEDTAALVREFRETYSGPIIAVSSSSSMQKELLEAGCSHSDTKRAVSDLVFEILGLQ